MENEQTTLEADESPVIPEPAPRKKRANRRSIIIFVVVSILNAGLLTLLFTQLLTPAQNGASNTDPLVGHPAPNFTLSALSLSGSTSTHTPAIISLSNYKGQPVVLNVWNSTCVPCIAEAPLLQAQWKQAKSRGVVFLGVDLQDAKSDGEHFLQKYSVTYPNVFDATGAVAISYGVTATPETFFINRQGIIVAHVVGQLTAQTIQRDLQLMFQSQVGR
jgi:cytochrome c biogenesis protein CcmG/thiol:disulfide interchange protein DsbE